MNLGSSSGGRTLRDRLREETSRAILEAAEAVLAEEGLQARMESIATRAGVSVGTLYNHFEHREGLVRALVQARRASLLHRIDGALAGATDRPVRDQLRAYLTAVGEHARAHGRLLAALVQAGEGPGGPRPPAELFADLGARAEAVVARGIAAGELRPDGDRVFAQAFVGMARAVLFRALDAGTHDAAVVDAVLDLFLRGACA